MWHVSTDQAESRIAVTCVDLLLVRQIVDQSALIIAPGPHMLQQSQAIDVIVESTQEGMTVDNQ